MKKIAKPKVTNLIGVGGEEGGRNGGRSSLFQWVVL